MKNVFIVTTTQITLSYLVTIYYVTIYENVVRFLEKNYVRKILIF